MNQSLKLSIFLIAIALAPIPGQAIMSVGGIGDGGGQGHVCRNDDGTVATAELLDLFEAENYIPLDLQQQPENRPYLEIAHEYAAILDSAIPLVMPTSAIKISNGSEVNIFPDLNSALNFPNKKLPGTILQTVDEIDAHKMLIPKEGKKDNFKIPALGDSHPHIKPTGKNCSIEQIAVYSDGTSQVRFVRSVWNHLINVHKAALLIHEALYRQLRKFGDIDSDRTRKTIAYLFSGMKFEWILDGLPEKYLFCWSDDENASYQFVVYPAQNDIMTAQFLVYNKEVMLTKTSTYLPAGPFAKAFGLPVPALNEDSKRYTLNNPLLELPNFEFSFWRNNTYPDSVYKALEAFSLAPKKEPLLFHCNKQLSMITFGADGSVGISLDH